MADNLSIQAPDFDRIRKGDYSATEDAVRLLWFVLNNEIKTRRQADRRIEERLSPLVLSMAPAANQNNLDTEGAGVLLFTGSSSVSVTGLIAREVGDIVFVHNLGSGTITLSNLSGSSDGQNQMAFQSGTDKSLPTNKSVVLQYYNTLWRELSLA